MKLSVCAAALACSPLASGFNQCQVSIGKNNGGDNLKQVSGLSGANACCDACNATAGCAGFTWVHWQSQCWLKSRVGELVDDSGVDSGSMGPSPPGPAPPAPPAPPTPPSPPAPPSPGRTVLVFGDSWGDYGPSYREVQDTFKRHNANGDVRSSARGYTTACGWARDPQAMVKAAKQLFPELSDGPEFVWYTLGGNDMGDDGEFHSCTSQAKSMDENFQCFQAATDKILACTRSMLDEYWKAFPKSKVMQCNYDVPCESGWCMNMVHAFMGNYCGNNITCINTCADHWQSIYVGNLSKVYPEPRYTGLNIAGAVQVAAGIPGAAVGKPVLNASGPCNMMDQCIHPHYGSKAAVAVGEAFWDLFFSKYVKAAKEEPHAIVV